ncbi:DUF6603 domain-containing protein [uncultured Chitinophaga sp.]|uniref:DUF6603 domain-containing protein n=1 Tax=uncultured Chitinophaga sp. TaxID=339340 RepID=UPI0025E63A8F|nr:DUF6603 domain-containing protein [uncultured Chitinophaga sp.]
MEAKDTLVVIAEELGKALQPLKEATSSPGALRDFLSDLGWDVAPPAAVNALKAPAELATRMGTDNEGFKASDVQQLITAVKGAFEAIANLKSAGGMVPAMANELPGQLLEYLLVEYFLKNQKAFGQLLRVLGIIRLEDIPAAAGRVAYRRRTFAFSEFANLFSDPLTFFKNAFKWGQSEFRGLEWQDAVMELLDAWGLDVEIAGLSPAALAELTKNALDPSTAEFSALKAYFIKSANDPNSLNAGVGLFITPETATEKPGFALMPFLHGELEQAIEITDKLSLIIKAALDLTGGVGILVRPGKDIKAFAGLDSGTPGNLTGTVSAQFSVHNPGEPFILIGSRDASRLEIGSISAEAGTRFQGQGGKFEVFTEFGVQQGKIVIKAGEADGFLATLLPGDGINVGFDLTVGFSSTQGLYFGGSGGLEIQLPAHIQLGPIEITSAMIALKPRNGEIPLELAATIKGDLGVLKATVENIGLKAIFTFPADGKGNLGPVNLALGFRPPNGVGLAVDAGIIKGGGYLFLDFDKGEYAGALELTFSEVISLKAIGIINTKMPDGSKGFSMLIIITAEFGTGIQLGFGFVLLGVGGLLGLNRTMNLTALAEGVRTGGVNSVMFPQNIIENAPRIISDLRTFFPIEQDKFLIGPMAKLGWGTPALISVSLGIIIEIPGNIAIVGIIKIALPTEEAAIIQIQVNFIGAIEFDKKRLWFYAVLYESRVLFMTIEGGMGLLIAWGDDSNFVISMGGFHPAFNPPPLPFPAPDRIAFNIINTSVAKVRVLGYFAVTSNTVQFGARVEIMLGFSACKLEGHLGFDALFQFSPFYFIIQISASLSVKVFGIGLFSVSVRMSLEGPTPYRAKGTGTISILFFDFDVDFDETWGESRNTLMPPIEILPKVREEFNKLSNWQAKLPAGSNILVSLRKIDESQELVLHPIGTLQVSQRYVPLGLTIEKVGSQKTSDVKKLTAETADGSGLEKVNDLRENFAMAQFQDMKNEEKLSRPSFEKELSGLELSGAGAQVKTGRAVRRVVRYELIIVDNNFKRFINRFISFFSSLVFSHFLRNNAVARSPLSAASKQKLNPYKDKVVATQPGFAVANTMNNKAYGTSAMFASEAQAREFMNQQISADPNLKESLHVISHHELNPAA